MFMNVGKLDSDSMLDCKTFLLGIIFITILSMGESRIIFVYYFLYH
jgi:hypothetical protein